MNTTGIQAEELPRPTRAWVTLVLMLLCLAYFVVMAAAGVSWLEPSAAALLRWGANFAPLTLTGEVWRLLSSVFMHIGLMHLLVNLFSLHALGQVSERLYGPRAFLAVFLMGGVAASLASAWHNLPAALAMAQGQSVFPKVAAGASGAIFALGGVLLVNARWPLPDQATRLQFRPLLVVLLLNLGLGFWASGIDNAAHVGGLVTGLLLGALYAGTAHARRPQRCTVRLACWLLGWALLGAWLYAMMSQNAPLLPLRLALLAEYGQQPVGFGGLH